MATITGTNGVDFLVGTAGIDTLKGLGGNDRLTGLTGADLLDGGDGIDTVNYDGAAQGVAVDLLFNKGTVGDAFGDTLLGFENVTGSAFADNIRGNGLANLLRGGASADLLDGSGGIDTADYATAKQGVLVSLLETTGFGGEAFGDRYISIENVTGSVFNDELEGDGADNLLSGGKGADTLFAGAGDDTLNGGAGNDRIFGGTGADAMNGGSGIDTLDYSFSAGGVLVDLAFQLQFHGDAEGDSISGFENLIGSANGDNLAGDDAANVLSGGAGNDLVRGFGGNDVVVGGAGADSLAGGDGVDTVDYSASPGGVRVDLAANKAGGLRVIGDPDPGVSDAAGDTIAGFENVTGSNQTDEFDHLTGSNGNNVLRGLAGSDGLSGLLGVDDLTGGAGDDLFLYGSTAESKVGLGNRDLIRDFRHAEGDAISLGIDGNPGAAGIQELHFIGSKSFGAPGQVRVFLESGDTVVAVNTTGNSGAEMEIQFADPENLVAADFIL